MAKSGFVLIKRHRAEAVNCPRDLRLSEMSVNNPFSGFEGSHQIWMLQVDAVSRSRPVGSMGDGISTSVLVQLCWGERGAAGSLGTGFVRRKVPLVVRDHPGLSKGAHGSCGGLNPCELLG